MKDLIKTDLLAYEDIKGTSVLIYRDLNQKHNMPPVYTDVSHEHFTVLGAIGHQIVEQERTLKEIQEKYSYYKKVQKKYKRICSASMVLEKLQRYPFPNRYAPTVEEYLLFPSKDRIHKRTKYKPVNKDELLRAIAKLCKKKKEEYRIKEYFDSFTEDAHGSIYVMKTSPQAIAYIENQKELKRTPFPSHILECLKALASRDGIEYDKYIDKMAKTALAQCGMEVKNKNEREREEV
jgi:hypothetical protein